MGERKEVSDDEAQEMVELYEEGLTQTEISNELGRPQATVSRHLRSRGYTDAAERAAARQRRYSRNEEAEIADMYEGGATGYEVAEEFGCSELTVYEIVRRNGGEVRSRGRSVYHGEDAERMADLWERGLSLNAIAEEVGCVPSTVSRHLNDAGYDIEKRWAEGADHGGWIGGYTHRQGYRLVRLTEDHPYYDEMTGVSDYVPEHRVVVAEEIGRPLRSDETVHHKNGVRDDNRLENLELRSSHHGEGQVGVCADCGSTNIEFKELGGEGNGRGGRYGSE